MKHITIDNALARFEREERDTATARLEQPGATISPKSRGRENLAQTILIRRDSMAWSYPATGNRFNADAGCRPAGRATRKYKLALLEEAERFVKKRQPDRPNSIG